LQLTQEMKDAANISEELITTPIRIPDAKPITIEKDAGVMEEISKYFIPAGRQNASANFSASKLQSYIHCPLQFYFRYVAHLKTTDEVTDEIDERAFGELLHESMRALYGEIKILEKKTIEALRKKVPAVVSAELEKLTPRHASLLSGKNLLLRNT